MPRHAALAHPGQLFGVVAEDVVDRAVEGIGEELEIGGRQIAAADDHVDVAHPFPDR
jgi:hypothetical protein